MVDVLGLQSHNRTLSQNFHIQYADNIEDDIPINPTIKVSNQTSYTVSPTTSTKYRTKLVKGLPGEIFRARVTVETVQLRRPSQRRYTHFKGYVSPQIDTYVLNPAQGPNLGTIDNQDILSIGNTHDIYTAAVTNLNTFSLTFSQSLSLPDLRLFYKDVRGNVFRSQPIRAQQTNSLTLSTILVNDTTLSRISSLNIYDQLQVGDTFDVILTTDLDITQTQFEGSLCGEAEDALTADWSPWQDIPTNKIITLPDVTDYNYFRIQCAESLTRDLLNPVIKVANVTSYTVDSLTGTKYRTKRVRALSGEIFRAKVTVGLLANLQKGYSTGNNHFGSIDNQDFLNLGSTKDIKLFLVRSSGEVHLEFHSILPLGENYRLFYSDQHGNSFYQNIGSSSNRLGATLIYSVIVDGVSTRIASTTIFSDLQEGDTFDIVITDRTVTQVEFEASLSGGATDALATEYSAWQDVPANKTLTLPSITTPDYYRIQCVEAFLPHPSYAVTKTASSGEYTISSKTATKYRTSTDEGSTWSTWQDIPTTKIIPLSSVSAPDYFRIRCADAVTSATIIPYKPVIKVANATSYTVSSPATKYRTKLVNALPGEIFRAKVTVGEPLPTTITSQPPPVTQKGFSDLLSNGYYGTIDTQDILNLGTTDDIRYFTVTLGSGNFRFSSSVDVHRARIFYHDTHNNTFYVDTFARTTSALTFRTVYIDGSQALLNTTTTFDDLSVGDTFDIVITTDRTVTQAQFEASLSGAAEDALAAEWSAWQDIPVNKTISLPAVTTPDYYRIQCTPRLIPDPSDTTTLVTTNPIVKVSNATSFPVRSNTATKYQTQQVNALQGEIFRARVTVGLSSADSSKGFSDNTSPSIGVYGSIDNKDFLNRGTTDDIEYIAIALNQNIFVLQSSLDVVSVRVFYHDSHDNSFYVDSNYIRSNNWNSAMINGTETLLSTTSFYNDLSVGDTFDVVITTDQTVTQAQFEASLSGAAEDALTADWSAWQDIPVNKTLTLPTKTVTTYQMIKIPVSLLQTTSYTPSFFPGGYPTDSQVLATFEGRIQNWGDFSGINPSANNQGSWDTNKNTQTIGGVSYTVERLVVSHGTNQVRLLMTSSDTLDNNRTNLAAYSFFFYRLDDNGNLLSKSDNTPWIEEYSVANANTTQSTFTFIWNITTTLEHSVLYVARGNTQSIPIGIKVAETSTNS